MENCKFMKNMKKIRDVEVLYVAIYELLFGQELVPSGGVEGLVLERKNALKAALARLLVKRNVSCIDDLLATGNTNTGPQVRYVRVNTLKISVDKALGLLKDTIEVALDDIVPGLFAIPAHTELHAHPLVSDGSLILQGKSSCIPALALAPETDWVVLDACAAPGNKTIQLAALMNGKGLILACELNEKRIKRLQDTVKLAGASNVKVMHQDFLTLDVNKSPLSQVKAILLDPSCSGSGTVHRRLDHLLPSFASQETGGVDKPRLEKLAKFQKKALQFALSFPAVERVVYSTCSVHQQENEDVVSSVLEFAKSNGFQLGYPLPQWQQRGLPIFDGAEKLLRVEPSQDMDGFFVALFERRLGSAVKADNTKISPPMLTQQKGELGSTSKKKGNKSKKKLKRKRLGICSENIY
ncbi:hypothetical protein KP509_01G010700 [Ceratopteris richardii]|nr:hypothetical protein KP509_01G010700 [Ceratopteris richardii]